MTERAKGKSSALTETPLSLRIPVDLLERIDALVPKVAADSNVATMLGGVSRSAVVRYALIEGIKKLETRHARRGGELDTQ